MGQMAGRNTLRPMRLWRSADEAVTTSRLPRQSLPKAHPNSLIRSERNASSPDLLDKRYIHFPRNQTQRPRQHAQRSGGPGDRCLDCPREEKSNAKDMSANMFAGFEVSQVSQTQRQSGQCAHASKNEGATYRAFVNTNMRVFLPVHENMRALVGSFWAD